MDKTKIAILLVMSMITSVATIDFGLANDALPDYYRSIQSQEIMSDNEDTNWVFARSVSTGLDEYAANMASVMHITHDRNQSELLVKLIADLVEDDLKQAANLLLVTSSDPRLEIPQYLSNISERDMGIPADIDTDKRDIAMRILALDKNFGSVYFLLPNADVYLGEPFSGQEQLPRLNYADRDWYKGIVATTLNNSRDQHIYDVSTRNNGNNISEVKSYYTSAVFPSASIHVPATAIAVPVYDKNGSINMEVYENSSSSSIPVNSTKTLVSPEMLSGYWVGVLNMNETRNHIDQLGLRLLDLRVLVVDHNGTAIIDTEQNKPLGNLESVRRALQGEEGSLVESMNGTRIKASYHPIDAFPHTWAAALIELYNDRPLHN